MYVVITYDVSTETPEGRRRLRHVAKACEGRGQRVQKSVFEVNVSQAELESLVERLLRIIETDEDSLRVYRIPEPHKKHIQEYGRQMAVDFDGPLVV